MGFQHALSKCTELSFLGSLYLGGSMIQLVSGKLPFPCFVQNECELRSFPSIVQRIVIFPITSSEASALISVENISF